MTFDEWWERTMKDFTVTLTEEQIEEMVVRDLKIHRDYCDDEKVRLACMVLLDFYGERDESN